MSAETANLLRMELETSDRLRGYWQETQTKLNAAIRERDEARADLENERAMRAGEHDDTHSRIEKLHAELVEARAELKEVCKEVHDGELYECRLERERDALRAVIEAHNKMCHDQCEIWAEITLPPAAAAPEAGPDFWALATEHGDEVAAPEAGAGPKPEFVAPPTCPVCFGAGYYAQETWGSNGYYRKDRLRCECAGLQQSPAQPEGGNG